jgi:small GTP-binding protein
MDLYEALESNVPQDKVVLVGNPGVGKSTIFQRFKTGKFVPVEELTHHDKEGQECYKEWIVSGTKRSMTLYDTAGVERHTQTMLPTYFRMAKAVILVYSIDNMESFGDIGSNWMDNSMSAGIGVQVVLVGNKVDLDRSEEGESKRAISQQRAMQYADSNDIEKSMVFEVSAKTGQGMQEMFDAVAQKVTPASTEQSEPVKPKPQQRDCSSC